MSATANYLMIRVFIESFLAFLFATGSGIAMATNGNTVTTLALTFAVSIVLYFDLADFLSA